MLFHRISYSNYINTAQLIQDYHTIIYMLFNGIFMLSLCYPSLSFKFSFVYVKDI